MDHPWWIPGNFRVHLAEIMDGKLAGLMRVADTLLSWDKKKGGNENLLVVENGVPLALVRAGHGQPAPTLLIRGQQVGIDALCNHD
jgi:hypothetical protein